MRNEVKFQELKNAILKYSTVAKFAKLVSVSTPTLYSKLKGNTEFTKKEVDLIIAILRRFDGRNYTVEELFKECD